jgi:hypothetical protein
MTRDTEQLLRRLAESATPVQPLARPYTRAAAWLSLSVLYISVVFLVMPARHDLASRLYEPLFMIEQFGVLATGITAAVAAFSTVVPGYSRKWIVLPLLPFAVWLGSLGPGCVQQVNRFGVQGLPLHHNPWCFPFIALFGAIPAASMVAMLRRGAPLTPHLTAALGALAAAGLGNLGVRLVHPEDVSVMLLVWHIGSVILFTAIAGSVGHRVLNWRSIIGASENIAR